MTLRSTDSVKHTQSQTFRAYTHLTGTKLFGGQRRSRGSGEEG